MGVHEAAKFLFFIGALCGIGGCVSPPLPNWFWGLGIVVVAIAGFLITGS